MKLLKLSDLKQFPDLYEFLTTRDLMTIEEKQYNFDNDVFIKVQSYETTPFEVRTYESHKKYVDLQYIVAGEELIIVAPLDKLTVCVPYDDAKDAMRYAADYHGEDHPVHAGEILVLWPEDGHMACVSIAGPCRVKKVVIKVPVGKI